MDPQKYPPVSNYGYIGDCHSSALVSRSGSIDWCCMPRVDSGSCFGRLLDWNRGGYCAMAPSEPYEISRRYIEGTLILETCFRTDGGETRLLDLFTMRRGGQHHPHKQLLRVVEGLEGQVQFLIEVAPRFDYGAIKPWIRRYNDGHYIAIGGSDGLLISSDFRLDLKKRHDLEGFYNVRKGHRIRLSIIYQEPEDLEETFVKLPDIADLDERFDETVRWWHAWSSKGTFSGPYARIARQSAILIKGLSNAPTGAIAAAATTSLPETPNGSRNWDYRFTWIRDSTLAVRSLTELGYTKEADGFRRFVQRSAAGSAEEVQILFGVGGERRLHEQELKELEGYRGARPVRIGNAAENQKQLDVYGELLELAWQWHRRGDSPDKDYWDFLVDLVNTTANLWKNPDRSIWEMRGKPRHFTYSKAMCWIAFDRGIKLSADLGLEAPVHQWETARDQVRRAIEEKGYAADRGVFTQAFGYPEMDASLLLLPIVGFIDFNDERMIRTTDAIMEELTEDGLLRRYRAGNDSLEGEEGVFIACSFWLVESLARQGRLDLAHKVFERALSTQNDLGLFSEEYDTRTEEMLGNFPQVFTHLSLISAAVTLTNTEGRKASLR